MCNIKKISEGYFDKIARNYDENRIPEPIRCYPLLLKRLPTNINQLLDIGCGTGTMIELISQSYRNETAKYIGIDLSKEMISIAENKAIKNASFKIGDAESIELNDSSCDVVICMHSFHHYPNPKKVISEIHRVLTPKGKLYIVDNYRKGISMIIKNFIILIYLRRKYGDIKVYRPSEIESMLASVDFAEIKHEMLSKKSFLIVGEK